jgi:hypothetical protein
MIEIYAKGNYFFIEKGEKKWTEYKIHVRFDNNVKDTERYNILINDKLQTEISGNSWKKFTNEGSRFASQEAFDTFIFANTGFKSASGGSGAGIEEAPEDGNIYGRKDAEWVEVSVDDELTPDELAGIQNANGLSGANPVATMGDIPEVYIPDLDEVLNVGNISDKDIYLKSTDLSRQSWYKKEGFETIYSGIITQLTEGRLVFTTTSYTGSAVFYIDRLTKGYSSGPVTYYYPRDNYFGVSTNFRLSTEEYTSRKNIKEVSASTYTLLATDKDLIIHFTNATGCTVTVPASLPINNRYEGKQRGTGQITFVGASGVTINVGASETNKTLEQFSVWGLDCVATDEYDLFGKLELA